MKIKITEIEASAEDLRQSKSLSEAFTDAFRRAFTPSRPIFEGVELMKSAVTEEETEDEDQI